MDVFDGVRGRIRRGQPLVVDKTICIVSPYPNAVFAIDQPHQGGTRKWVYQ